MSETKQAECPISGGAMKPVFSETVLGKYRVAYFYCEHCGLLRTESPYWLSEAYRDAIADMDTGLVARNIANGNAVEAILYALGIRKGKLLDVAGGYGLLARLLRDKGYDCYTTDKYCQNLFAKTFEPDGQFKAKALFAFEVLEHIENPVDFLTTAFQTYHCKTMIFSTLTFAGTVPPKDWWYYAFESGQHISFYQPRTLSLLADRLGCKYHALNAGLHIFTKIKIGKILKRILSHDRLRQLYSMHVRHKRKGSSKTWADHLKMKERLKTGGDVAEHHGSGDSCI